MTDAPARPFGRNLADFLDGNGQLPPPEQKLREACARGRGCVLGVTRPKAATPENTVRAGFVRFLALGGDDSTPVHEKGVWLSGAWIEGVVDLSFASVSGHLLLQKCRLSDLNIREAKLSVLTLAGSNVEGGINGFGVRVTGSVSLHQDFWSGGPVLLVGAHIGGYLSCTGSIFEPSEGDALCVAQALIGGTILLGSGFNARGQMDFSGAKVGGLMDPEVYWPKVGNIVIDGMTIGRFVGDAPTNGAARIRWLERQDKSHLEKDFRPQPWEETIRVLREMGHDEDARVVAIAKQAQLRLAGKVTAPWLHAVWGGLAGYGYRPLRLVGFMIAVLVFCSAVFWAAETQGVFAPTSPVLHTDTVIASACRVGPDAGDAAWTRCTQMPDAYTTFQPFWYSLDLILPVVELQQDQDWAPAVTVNGQNFGLGMVTRWVMWFEILFGWVASLMLIAILTNLVKKD